MHKRFPYLTLLCLFALRTSGQAPQVELAVGPVFQRDAPVQVVGIKESGDNFLATVIIKNATDKYVQDFTITWTIFRPPNCAASGPAPRVQPLKSEGHQIYAKVPNPPSPPENWGARVLKPHEQIEVTYLSLSGAALMKLAKESDAKKLRIQVGIAYVNFTSGDKVTSHNGPPDWRDKMVEETNILDAHDAAAQACG